MNGFYRLYENGREPFCGPGGLRHERECEHFFTPHFRIKKRDLLHQIDGRGWILFYHVSPTHWKWMGRYSTHYEAIVAMSEGLAKLDGEKSEVGAQA